MIETVAALVAMLLEVNTWMMKLPAGRSWALGISYTLSNAQLEANRPACCVYLKDANGVIFRSEGTSGTVFLINLAH